MSAERRKLSDLTLRYSATVWKAGVPSVPHEWRAEEWAVERGMLVLRGVVYDAPSGPHLLSTIHFSPDHSWQIEEMPCYNGVPVWEAKP